jgi:hypothetical protein
MRVSKGAWIFSGLIAVSAVLLTWLLHGESSPLADYFGFHTRLPNLWGTLNAVPFIAAAVISGNHGGGAAALFTTLQLVQWFVVAFALSSLFSRMFRSPRER